MRSKGFLLVLALLLGTILLIGGMAFLGKRSLQYRGSVQISAAAQARELAESGLEDARVKLQKDLLFPPTRAVVQPVYSYQERLYGLDGTTAVGVYSVSIDTRWEGTPYQVLVITAVGRLERSTAVSRRLRAELDVAPVRNGLPNPDLFRYRNFRDEGSL